MCMPGAHRDQKRVLSSLELESLVVVSHHVDFVLNPGPFREQPVFLTAEPFLQPLVFRVVCLFGGGSLCSGFHRTTPASIPANSEEGRFPIFLHPQHCLFFFFFMKPTWSFKDPLKDSRLGPYCVNFSAKICSYFLQRNMETARLEMTSGRWSSVFHPLREKH